jgi:hypothetical protein
MMVVAASVLYFNGKRFNELPFQNEDEFERLVVENSGTLFGEKSLYIDLKSRVEGRVLGSAIPDGLLIDFRDPENPEFYLVEVELSQHDFYKHIFPQVTKFFAFFKNERGRAELVEKTFTVINSDQSTCWGQGDLQVFEGHSGEQPKHTHSNRWVEARVRRGHGNLYRYLG